MSILRRKSLEVETSPVGMKMWNCPKKVRKWYSHLELISFRMWIVWVPCVRLDADIFGMILTEGEYQFFRPEDQHLRLKGCFQRHWTSVDATQSGWEGTRGARPFVRKKPPACPGLSAGSACPPSPARADASSTARMNSTLSTTVKHTHTPACTPRTEMRRGRTKTTGCTSLNTKQVRMKQGKENLHRRFGL